MTGARWLTDRGHLGARGVRRVRGHAGSGDAVIGHDDDDPRLRGRAWGAATLRGGEPHTQLRELAQRARRNGEGFVAGDRGPMGFDVRRGHLGEIHPVILPAPP